VSSRAPGANKVERWVEMFQYMDYLFNQPFGSRPEITSSRSCRRVRKDRIHAVNGAMDFARELEDDHLNVGPSKGKFETLERVKKQRGGDE